MQAAWCADRAAERVRVITHRCNLWARDSLSPLQTSCELTIYINMFDKSIMFRLHIVCCGLSFCGQFGFCRLLRLCVRGKEMRKCLLLGVILALSSGCGRGWLPMFRGAPCNNNVCAPASYDRGCTNCPTAAGYGEYSGEYSGVETLGGNYYNGGIVSEDYPIQGSVSPMQPLSQPAN